MTRDVTPLPKGPVRPVKARKRVKPQRAGTPAALKRKATKLWGEYIHKRDRVCRWCGRSDIKLEAHHVIPREFCATRADPANGVLLCYQHHKGRDGVHMAPVEAVWFYERALGPGGYDALYRKAHDGVARKYPAEFWQNAIDELERLLGAVR